MPEGPHPSYRIVSHDPSWADVFKTERLLIAAALNLPLSQVEHIGSTAIPGLGAKPIVDVMVGVGSEVHYPPAVDRLTTLGYQHRGETVPGTLYCRKEGPPRINAHVCVFEGAFWVDHLLFRDFLRAHPQTACDYEQLKRRILAEVGQDPPAYNARKTVFIERVLARAKRKT